MIVEMRDTQPRRRLVHDQCQSVLVLTYKGAPEDGNRGRTSYSKHTSSGKEYCGVI